jgi:hypothetical protein
MPLLRTLVTSSFSRQICAGLIFTLCKGSIGSDFPPRKLTYLYEAELLPSLVACAAD